MDIQCAAVVVCVRPGEEWPTAAGGRRVVAAYLRSPAAGAGPADTAGPAETAGRAGRVAVYDYPAGVSPAGAVGEIADRHRGEAAVAVMTEEELAALGVSSGTALAVDSEGFVRTTAS
ncbi:MULTISPECIES: hypothetical protein [unclassified Pseudactinotalea]|uniref:hypothetical protein n=1 Tax=unclassified Pseudactinotalea TaxID=2649176 RepID=UPI00128DDBF5|nr:MULTISPECIES: hypothetical protein [unclassified Pseudactinotalea]MPV50029.1 hypothetical protein [Pseudactinotalea sp. HY160]QGH69492.1 hypothetical protein GCE65_08130 [Pseudactinotalea sp. HY158]